MVQRDNHYGYVDDSAREIIPCSFSDANLFYDSIAAVGNGNLFGFINYDGKVFINYQYKAALHFSEGLAAVQDTSTGLWGFINTNGDMVIKPLLLFRYWKIPHLHKEV